MLFNHQFNFVSQPLVCEANITSITSSPPSSSPPPSDPFNCDDCLSRLCVEYNSAGYIIGLYYRDSSNNLIPVISCYSYPYSYPSSSSPPDSSPPSSPPDSSPPSFSLPMYDSASVQPGRISTPCCPMGTAPTVINALIQATGDFSPMNNQVVQLVYDPAQQIWYWFGTWHTTFSVSGGQLSLFCDSAYGGFVLRLITDDCDIYIPVYLLSCEPFSASTGSTANTCFFGTISFSLYE